MRAFTLVELMVSISIIAVLIGLSIFGLVGARETARDAKRKGDLEQIRSALEIYRSDCTSYPATLGTILVGDGTNCPTANVYMESVPEDPIQGRLYSYTRISTFSYKLCSALEKPPSTPATGCGSCGAGITCNYAVTNP